MANSNQVNCATCEKGKGTFKCEGCLQIFCPKDSIYHRDELNKKLEEIELTRNLIHQTYIQQSKESKQNLLLNKINQWEQKSITKIHQLAEEERNKIFKQTIYFEQKLKDITKQLQKARENEDFVENDLQQWKDKLNDLENNLINPNIILIEEKSISFITKIHIEHENKFDIFHQVCGDVQIEENGYLITKDNWIGFSEVLGKKEYTNGQHFIRFKIEQLNENGWILFGIISKLEPITINSYNSPSSYGWTTNDRIYIAGQYQKIQNNNNTKKNDIITLIIDCDQKKIQMKNENTGRIMELSIDTNKCSFPWKLHFNLLTASSSIRILPVSD